MEHTELPWSQDLELKDFIYSKHFKTQAPGDTIAECEANAEFIVRACNSHYKLLEALKNLMSSLGGGTKACGHQYDCNCAWVAAQQIIKEVEGEK